MIPSSRILRSSSPSLRPLLSSLSTPTRSPPTPSLAAPFAVHRRNYASHSTFNPPPTLNPLSIFSPTCKSAQRARAIRRLREQGHSPSLVDYVREEVAERLAERVEDLREKPGRVLEVQAHKGELMRVLWEVLGDEVELAKGDGSGSGNGTGGDVDGVHGKRGKREGKREWVMMEDSEALWADEFDCRSSFFKDWVAVWLPEVVEWMTNWKDSGSR